MERMRKNDTRNLVYGGIFQLNFGDKQTSYSKITPIRLSYLAKLQDRLRNPFKQLRNAGRNK